MRDRSLLYSGGFDSQVLVWSPAVQEPLGRLQGHSSSIIKIQPIRGTYEIMTAGKCKPSNWPRSQT